MTISVDVMIQCFTFPQIRFLHDPSKAVGYVGAALSSTMVRFFKKDDDTWDTQVIHYTFASQINVCTVCSSLDHLACLITFTHLTTA